MPAWLYDPNVWASFVTLTVLEIVLGIDNLIFLALVVGRLPPEQQATGRLVGLSLALAMRLALLASIWWLARLVDPLFNVAGHGFSARDLILIAGGAFLVYKGTAEIHNHIEGEETQGETARPYSGFLSVVGQIVVLDLVFSLDSVITAVGMSDNLWVMAAAVVVAIFIMLLASASVARFIEHHPTVKMLALAFLLMIGMVLVADGVGFHIPKGFIYAAMAFAVGVEALNMLARRRRTHKP